MDKIASVVIVNGREVPLPEGGGLTDLLQSLRLDPCYVLIELNGQALLRDAVSSTRLTANDRVEIVRPVAGG